MSMNELNGKILVLDDEAELKDLLSRYLGSQGYLVRQAADPEQLDRLLQRESFDLLILDIMMPGEDGLSICKRLRLAGETVPILMLTARSDTIDRILGFEMGADDYLEKPFEPRELLARITAIQRRQAILGAHHQQYAQAPVHFGPYTLDVERRQLWRDDKAVPLHGSEFNLLQVMAANAGRVLSRERLIELSQGRNVDVTARSIDVQILRLRRTLEEDPANPEYILTVRGRGYMLVKPDQPR